jgi:hypothetical protein
MSKKTQIVIAASLGGIAPNIIRTGIALTGNNATLPEWTYVFGILIFAIMGGAIGWVCEEENLMKAFYLGIGLPSLIQLNFAHVTPPPSILGPSLQTSSVPTLATPWETRGVNGAGGSEHRLATGLEIGERSGDSSDFGSRAPKSVKLDALMNSVPVIVQLEKKQWSGLYGALGFRDVQ